MIGFFGEAFFLGVKTGGVLSFCLFLALSRLGGLHHGALRKPVFAGIVFVLAGSVAAFFLPVTVEVRERVVTLTGSAFGFFYLFSLAALFQSTGIDVTGPLRRLFDNFLFLSLLVFSLTVLYCIPETAGTVLYVSDLSAMAGRGALVWSAAGIGFVLAVAAVKSLGARLEPAPPKLPGLPQLLLSLALIKLVFGGVHGFTELSLIPSVKAGLMKFVHDAIHQILIMLLVPDHPVLSTTAWNAIALLFGEAAGLWLSLFLFFVPLAFFLKRHFSTEITVPGDLDTGAARRKHLRKARIDRTLKALPVAAFMVFIGMTWFSQRGESADQRYNPDPKPLIAEGAILTVPIQSPGDDLLDGRIHKYTVQAKGEDVRVLIMKKPDATLAVCLDACDICPPDGYAQGREHVICLYCNTPIPFETVGKPGGCNPIPVAALVTDKNVRIEMDEIMKKWMTMKTGSRKEGIRK